MLSSISVWNTIPLFPYIRAVLGLEMHFLVNIQYIASEHTIKQNISQYDTHNCR